MLKRILVGAAAIIVILAALTPILLKRFLPPERVRELVAKAAQERLGRQVRIGEVSYGLRGVALSDVVVSERPDFSAGTFAEASRLRLRPAWLPLLRGQVQVDYVSAQRLDVRISRAKDGRFNFSDLTSSPAAGPAASASAGSASEPAFDVDVRRAYVQDSRLRFRDAEGDDLEVSGIEARVTNFRPSGPFDASLALFVSGRAGGRPVKGGLSASARVDLGAGRADLKAKTPGFVAPAIPPLSASGRLAYGGDRVDLRRLSLQTPAGEIVVAGSASGVSSGAPSLKLQLDGRSLDLAQAGRWSGVQDLGLAGKASFTVAVKGKAARPAISGQARLENAGATISGLKLSGFTGAVALTEQRIDVPDLRGRVGDGQLRLKASVENYQVRPSIEVHASLDQLDVGPFLAALGSKPQAPPSAPQPGAPAAAQAPVDTRGDVSVGRLIHPDVEAQQVRLSWQLTGVTPDLRRLSGSAKASSSGGQIHLLSESRKHTKAGKVLLFPLLVMEKVGHLGGIRILPDFSRATYTELAGDYSFQNGLMTINDSHLTSSAGRVKAKGQVDLPGEKLAMTVSTQIDRMTTPLEISVGGTFDSPKIKLKADRLIEQSAEQILESPAKKLLENLFKR